MDGNVLRVISRLLAWEEDITKQSVKRKMEAALLELMKRVHPIQEHLLRHDGIGSIGLYSEWSAMLYGMSMEVDLSCKNTKES